MRTVLVVVALIVMAISAPRMAAQKVELSIDASKPGAKIDRNLFGQFDEHLGHGIYDGIWVGADFRTTPEIQFDLCATDMQEFYGRFREGVAAGELHCTFRYHFAFKRNPRDVTVTLLYNAREKLTWVLVQPIDSLT
jgi:hypothetical protein